MRKRVQAPELTGAHSSGCTSACTSATQSRETAPAHETRLSLTFTQDRSSHEASCVLTHQPSCAACPCPPAPCRGTSRPLCTFCAAGKPEQAGLWCRSRVCTQAARALQAQHGRNSNSQCRLSPSCSALPCTAAGAATAIAMHQPAHSHLLLRLGHRLARGRHCALRPLQLLPALHRKPPRLLQLGRQLRRTWAGRRGAAVTRGRWALQSCAVQQPVQHHAALHLQPPDCARITLPDCATISRTSRERSSRICWSSWRYRCRSSPAKQDRGSGSAGAAGGAGAAATGTPTAAAGTGAGAGSGAGAGAAGGAAAAAGAATPRPARAVRILRA